MDSKSYSDEKMVGNGHNLNLEASQPPMVENVEYNLAQQYDQLERGLESRHIQFLALGGAIGKSFLFCGRMQRQDAG